MAHLERSRSSARGQGEDAGPHALSGSGAYMENTWSISPRPPPDGFAGIVPDKLTSKMKKQGEKQEKALGMTNDPRFREMKHFRDYAGPHAVSARESDQDQQKRYSFAETEAEPPTTNPNSIDGRIAWQDSFDSTVNRLMVDFSLSDDPDCRLNHLDRLYSWFKGHGQKQVRKVRASPGFLTVEKNAPPAMGSTRNVTAPLSNTSLVLADTMTMRRSRRMPPAQSMFNKSPPPKIDIGRKYRP